MSGAAWGSEQLPDKGVKEVLVSLPGGALDELPRLGWQQRLDSCRGAQGLHWAWQESGGQRRDPLTPLSIVEPHLYYVNAKYPCNIHTVQGITLYFIINE